jgi:hypothetical protein
VDVVVICLASLHLVERDFFNTHETSRSTSDRAADAKARATEADLGMGVGWSWGDSRRGPRWGLSRVMLPCYCRGRTARRQINAHD